jgi:hypothetical protein
MCKTWVGSASFDANPDLVNGIKMKIRIRIGIGNVADPQLLFLYNIYSQLTYLFMGTCENIARGVSFFTDTDLSFNPASLRYQLTR